MSGETVLAVDDRLESLQFLREYVLEPSGYEVIQANDGMEALKIAKSYNIDLIISDLEMPRMGGLELFAALRENGLDIPSILMTFHGTEGTAVQAFRLGASDYIIKPFTVEEMLEAVDRALAVSRLKKERDNLTDTLLRVNQQLEGRIQETRILYGIGRSITSVMTLEQILNRIVEAAVYLTDAMEGSLMLVDPETNQLYLRATRSSGDKYAHSLYEEINSSIAGQVLQTGRPVIAQGRNQHDVFKVTTGYLVKSLLNVPLKERDTVIGVLAVNNKVTGQAFTDHDLNLLMGMADYASIAIQNARMYDQLSSDVDRIEQSNRELKRKFIAQTAQLKTAHKQLIKTEKAAALGYLASGVAKEIEAPISAILNGLDQLGQNGQHQQLVHILKQKTMECRQIVTELLDFSDDRALQLQEINVNRLLAHLWKKCQENPDYQNIQLKHGFDPNIPGILVDIEQIEVALSNLFYYALDSMPQGGILRISTRSEGGNVQVILATSGPGLAKEDLAHIFDPFYQSETQAHGLELSIAQSVIHRHQGQVKVVSQPEQGITFTIDLPR